MQHIGSNSTTPPSALAVTSSAIAGLAYDPIRGTLHVQFRDGTTYQYVGVPLRVYEDLMQAESKGAHFNRCVRPHYLGAPARYREISLG
jgi:hypothetical protein